MATWRKRAAAVLWMAGACSCLGALREKEEVREAAAAGNRFAVGLYEGVKGAGGNVAVGPLCVSNALTLLAAGAKGGTREGMVKGLGWEDPVGVSERWGKLMRAVLCGGGSVDLRAATGVWVRKGVAVRKEFVKVARDSFGAEVGSWDAKDAAAGAKKISGWVERNTNGRIRDFVDAGTLDRADVFVGGTTYFKGKWAEPFDVGETADGAFRVGEGKSVVAKMMREFLQHPGYAETKTCRALWLPYTGEASMVVVLPKGGIEEVEKEMVKRGVGEVVRPGKEKVNATVYLPRFKVRGRYALGGVLRGMGMKLGAGADFSGMVEKPVGVTSVVQEAVVEVDEAGTEAAAAVGIGVGSAPLDQSARAVEFKADHPFLFLIVHEKTGAVLFMGRVMDPTMSE